MLAKEKPNVYYIYYICIYVYAIVYYSIISIIYTLRMIKNCEDVS